MVEDDEIEKILKIIQEREIDDVKFERFKDTFTLKCERCGRMTARDTVIMGRICLVCDPHMIQKDVI